jgi:bifunctional DNase/RNase
LHKARGRLRDYITAHRPDLIPVTSRRPPMTTVRIAHAQPWPGKRPDGGMIIRRVLVVLADDAGHRALPVRLSGPDGSFWRLLAGPEDRAPEDYDPEKSAVEMTGELLRAAGIVVTAVHVTELGPEVTAAQIELGAPGGARRVTTRLADGLALAVVTGAPLTVAGPLMDRFAEPVSGPDLLGPFRSRQQAVPMAPRHKRFEPRNLAFSDGLDAWRLGGSFRRGAAGHHEQDYSCATEDGRAILTAAVPAPAGFAFLHQQIFADDYHGQVVVFRAELRTTDVADRAGLVLRVTTEGRLVPQRRPDYDPRQDPGNHFAVVRGSSDWTRHEVTAEIPGDADTISFGAFLTGSGQVEVRHPELERHP